MRRRFLLLLLGSGCARDQALTSPCGADGSGTITLVEGDFVRRGASREDREDDGVIELVPAERTHAGSAVDESRLYGPESIEVALSLSIGGGTGADGMAIVLIDRGRIEEAVADGYLVGGTAACLGYAVTPDPDDKYAGCGEGDRWLPGLAVEIDTWWNAATDPVDVGGDPISPHGAVVVDADIAHPRATWPIDGLEREVWHEVTVSLEAGTLAASVDGRPLWAGEVDWEPVDGVLVGFTASTGTEYDRHAVRDVSVRAGACQAQSAP